MTALAARVGGEETTTSASATTTKVARPPCRHPVSRLARATAANARPASAASISLWATAII